jgi:hypothetical protein
MTIITLVKKSLMPAVGATFVAMGTVGTAQAATVVNFDTDANGNPISAPSGFVATSPLADLYASQGVRFRGLNSATGGAILDQGGNFGVNARSGTNFLAFNRSTYATDPESIIFDTLLTSLSIFAGSRYNDSFTLTAFDINDVQIGVSSVLVNAGTYEELSFSSLLGNIKRVSLSANSAPDFVFDDLAFEPATPIPTPALLPGLIGMGIAILRRRKADAV